MLGSASRGPIGIPFGFEKTPLPSPAGQSLATLPTCLLKSYYMGGAILLDILSRLLV